MSSHDPYGEMPFNEMRAKRAMTDPITPEERRIGKITSVYLGYEDHDIFTATIHFDYGGLSQGLPGYSLDHSCAKFIKAVLDACGVRQWEKLVGRTVFCVIRDGLIRGLIPLPTEPGVPVDFEELMSDA